MKKSIYLWVVLLCFAVFGACQNRIFEKPVQEQPKIVFNSLYGNYLAGRVAHIRKDFNAAADYYAKTVEVDKNNQLLLSQIYIIYTSQGDLHNASKYARKLQENGDKNSFLDTIIAVDEIKEKNYKKVIEEISDSDVPIYKHFINPLILAWAYAGENNLDAALKQIEGFKNDKNLMVLYNFQKAMIYDYFNKPKEAEKYYNEMAVKYQKQLSFRALQLMSNFYLRQGQKQKAEKLVKLYKNDELFAPMLKRLLKNIAETKNEVNPIIDTPSLGLAESLFSIAATLRAEGQNIDLAHLFTSMAIYSNPKYDLAKLLLADILEERGMYLEANDLYNTVDKTSDAYFIILRKMADNYAELKEYKKAIDVLTEVVVETPDDVQIYLSLGDLHRNEDDFLKASEYYEKGIEKIKKVGYDYWPLYYSLGISYDKLGQWDKAEDMLLKTVDLSNDHYLVQNYLGYTWLVKNIKVENAFALIVDAYRQAPNDGNIADSLGYAFYKLGYYNRAIEYLEEATLLEPNNAVVFEHLGDAYYMAGRKNEAGFQWNQALSLESDEPEFDAEVVKQKLLVGIENKPIEIQDKKFVEDKIKELEDL